MTSSDQESKLMRNTKQNKRFGRLVIKLFLVGALNVPFVQGAFAAAGSSSIGGVVIAAYAVLLVLAVFLFVRLRRIASFLWPRDNPLLRREMVEFPVIKQFIFRPYVNSHWSSNKKMSAIEDHYSLVNSRVPFLNLSNGDSVDVADLELAGEKLRIVLDRPSWMRGEGELGISLFHGIDRIYTAMFSISDAEGKLQIVVGNLQGDGRDRSALYKEFTKVLFGMRPRDFLVHVIKLFGESLGCIEILGIADAGHRSSHWATKAKKVSTYDAIWSEHGGVKDEKLCFFRIPAHFSKRADADISTNKRAQYRRRYQLIDDLQARIKTRVSGFAEQKINDAGNVTVS